MKNLTLCFALCSAVALVGCSGTAKDGATGPAGLVGPEGPAGPMGAMGDPGMNGTNGTNGAMGNMGTMGAQGPAGPTLFKRTTFRVMPVSMTAGNTMTLLPAVVTFTPPTSGTAVISARGHCTMQAIAASDNLIDIEPQVTLPAGSATTPFATNSEVGWGRAMVPDGSPTGVNFLPMWTTEITLAVTAATQYTVDLYSKRQAGTTAADCSGSFFVQVFTSTLPN